MVIIYHTIILLSTVLIKIIYELRDANFYCFLTLFANSDFIALTLDTIHKIGHNPILHIAFFCFILIFCISLYPFCVFYFLRLFKGGLTVGGGRKGKGGK